MESLAMKRARERGYFDHDANWYFELKSSTINGLGPEVGVHRRDPSSVLFANGKYYVWYTKSVGESVGRITHNPADKQNPWDMGEIWYATSEDQINWTEQGCAVPRGTAPAYDDRCVFTPEAMTHDGKYYLVYQVLEGEYTHRVQENIAIAIADSPDGPFVKSPAPILFPSNDGVWDDKDSDSRKVIEKGSFDSHKVHDPTLFFYNNKYYLYYKGETMGEDLFMGGRETKWGVAIADKAEGPYIKSEYNPVTNSGHETCLWEYEGGMAALLATDGMERNTVQYAKDGFNFDIKSSVKLISGVPGVSEAFGPFRCAEPKRPLDGIRWGLCHTVYTEWNYILRFDLDETQKRRSSPDLPVPEKDVIRF